jgi:hypothetical protein
MIKLNKTTIKLLAIICLGIFFIPYAASGNSTHQDKTKGEQEIKEQATPIREGTMSAKQREHRRLYSDYGSRKKLKDLQPSNNSNIIEVRSSTSIPLKIGTEEDMTAPIGINPTLFNLAQEADLIIVGTINSKQSQITENEDFLFTDHEVQVNEILYNEANSPVQENGIVTITKPGGTVELDGKIIRGIDVEFKPLEIGERYLFFLRFIPSTASYQAYRTGTFLLKGDKVFKLTKKRPMRRANGSLSEEEKTDESVFLSEVRTAISVKPRSRRRVAGNLY